MQTLNHKPPTVPGAQRNVFWNKRAHRGAEGKKQRREEGLRDLLSSKTRIVQKDEQDVEKILQTEGTLEAEEMLSDP